jgi:hypothetical protein
LRTVPVICHACTSGAIELGVISVQKPVTGAKRKIEVKAAIEKAEWAWISLKKSAS